jgi:hypothetical protein
MRPLTIPARELLHLSEAVLGRGGSLRFEASGGSMVPFIRPGDVLGVEPVAPGRLSVGDVALYCVPDGYPLAHRVVRPPGRESGGRWVLCADARPGEWELVRPGALLGRVVWRERRGRRQRLDRGLLRWLGAQWARGYPLTWGVVGVLRLVRRLVRRWMS